jgi:thiamine-phosphate pyrophosphorylase
VTPAPVLIAITDSARGAFERWLVQLEHLFAAAAPGTVQVMLRDRELCVRERLALGTRLRELATRHEQTLSVNDRLDLAALLAADAVHLAESSVPVADARALASAIGRSWWISRACHHVADVGREPADGIVLAPIAAARKGRPALGTAGVERAAAELRGAPVGSRSKLYALGGVSSANAASLLAAGADGVALIGALLEPDAPRLLVERLGIRR